MRAVILLAFCIVAASADEQSVDTDDRERELTTDSYGSGGSYGSGSYSDGSYDGGDNPDIADYDATVFQNRINSYTTVTNVHVNGLTVPPTAAPTAYPTAAGYTMVATTVATKKIIVPAISFPIPEAVANSEVMQAAMCAGFSASLNLPPEACTVESVVGHTPGRMLSGGHTHTNIKFGMRSTSTADADTLKDNIVTVASSGSLIHHIQDAAGEAGVLTASLKNMAIQITVSASAMEEDDVTYTTYVATEDAAEDEDDNLPIILGAVFGGLAVLLICVFLMTRSGSSQSASPTLTPKGTNGEPVTNV